MKFIVLSKTQGMFLTWLAPFLGAFLTEVVMNIRLALCSWSDYLSPSGYFGDFCFEFMVWFIRDSMANLIVLPLLFFARWLGLRHTIGFMLLTSLVTYPIGYYISDPNNVFSPTEKSLSMVSIGIL